MVRTVIADTYPLKKGNKSGHSGSKNSKTQSKSHQTSKGKSNTKEKYYQAIVDSKKPKKSKLERIFGDEAARIRIESARISDKDKKNGYAAKSRGQTPPSQKGTNVSIRGKKGASKPGKR